MKRIEIAVIMLAVLWAGATAWAGYTNFEASHVHPIALTPDGTRLLAVNTPDALLEVFAVQPDGSLSASSAIPVGLEPVSVIARNNAEAWVVNNLSDTISIVDLSLGLTVRTLEVGDEPTDVAFAGGRAFVSVSQEDKIRAWSLSDLDAAPAEIPLFGRDVRALDVAPDGQTLYAVVLRSGNLTSIAGAHHTFPADFILDPARLTAMNLRDFNCEGPQPAYPPLPAGITRNPDLTDPPSGVPPVALMLTWNEATEQWIDEAGQDWSHCLHYKPSDQDLFAIDVASLAVSSVRHLGTTLFEVSVNPANGKIYVPNTDARNFVRFEHPLGVQGHMVENQLSVVDPANANGVTRIDLNTHIDRASTPPGNLSERQASISQPGMLVWKADGSKGYLTAIGSHKIFEVDGSCTSGNCVFGPNRAAPRVAEVGLGPSGVALNEAQDRLYVLNRISNSLTTVEASTLTPLEETPLHDPSSESTREGRLFLYDAIDLSAHGDAACSSCHISGDHDGLSWDLGNPAGEFVPYSTPLDNVRFVTQGFSFDPVPCDPGSPFCAGHAGFDPQKGPMATMTLRSMLEPLHWRGDRATMNDFNMAFVGLMGAEDIGPVAGKPAGLSAADMETFRQFALDIQMPPNPYREVDDSLPCGRRGVDPGCEVQHTGMLFPGNPTEGDFIFHNLPTDGGLPCSSCHNSPFGTAGGKVGGVTPVEPTSTDATALFSGDFNASPHNDLEVAHLRNLYDKIGPDIADVGTTTLPEAKTMFGYLHEGSIPDLYRYLSQQDFILSAANQAAQVRDTAAFLFHFPTGTRPAVGRQLTLPAGTPPTGSPDDEALLTTLIDLGDLADVARHCELTVSTLSSGRLRAYHLSGGAWVTDVATEPGLTTLQLRESAQDVLTFLCAPIGSGARLGGNRDEDVVLNGDDCAPGDADTWRPPSFIDDLELSAAGALTQGTWTAQSAVAGPSIRYDVLTGGIQDLTGSGLGSATCLVGDGSISSFEDTRPDPLPGQGFYYLIRAENPCGSEAGTGREALDALTCGP
ncbi:hypothetical protein ABI59_17100 [Acidobacteria bacterium Mor1]|nr:hypothetical protein ABI59_17100 [Acidobacteria bacterium Mor1]